MRIRIAIATVAGCMALAAQFVVDGLKQSFPSVLG